MQDNLSSLLGKYIVVEETPDAALEGVVIGIYERDRTRRCRHCEGFCREVYIARKVRYPGTTFQRSGCQMSRAA